ncbi:MAG: ferritin-like domain-containing protein [Synechococcales bacterium]|nr:ferritin-like domain-containing protein [Synechococcales bacterium]
MNQPLSVAGLELPPVAETSKLRCILQATLTHHRIPVGKAMHPLPSPIASDLTLTQARSPWHPPAPLPLPPDLCLAYWDTHYFGLDRVALFQDASPDEQRAILTLANQNLLEEAYFIEKAGMGYMSRMALLADSIEERMLYTLFAAEETTHFVQLSPFLANQPTGTRSSFLQLLAELVESEDKSVLLFVIQVVLEGWGLTHYRQLAASCQDVPLAHLLRSFLQDESRHHGTGVTLFNQMSVSPASHAAIVEILAQFLQMVQVGPQGIVGAIAQVKGGLSYAQRLQIFEELDAPNHSGDRLRQLRTLMRGEGAGQIVQALEERGAFQPWMSAECAAV